MTRRRGELRPAGALRYADLREQLAIGDLVLFSGRGLVSSLIKVATASCWSHVGVVARTASSGARQRVEVIESTSLDGFAGVTKTMLSQRVGSYRGTVHVARLKQPLASGDAGAFYEFLTTQVGKPYDFGQVALAWLDRVRFGLRRDQEAWFCSELVAAAFARIGRWNGRPKTCTPDDLARAPFVRLAQRVVL